MLDGIWHVYKEDGTFLGKFETRISNDVLIVDEKTAQHIEIGQVLHMEEIYSSKAWKVKVIRRYQGKETEFVIEKLGDRVARYAVNTV